VRLFDGDLVSNQDRRGVRPAVGTGHTLRLASRVVDVSSMLRRSRCVRAASMGTSKSSPGRRGSRQPSAYWRVVRSVRTRIPNFVG
jgi:hypothetical protein